MIKKLILIFLLLVGAGFTLWLYQNITNEDRHFAVQNTAKSKDNYLLDLKGHISQTKRPNEHFSFPIAIGAIGPSESLYSGPNQYPFYCMSRDSKLGQPEVDNHEALGVPVYDSDKVIGYSKDCGVKTRIDYYTLHKKEGSYIASRITDVETAKHTALPLFRVEQGTINRFIYTLIMPIKNSELGDRLAKSKWNKRLIYQFNGGSGIGFRQGRQKASRVMTRQAQQLLDGYAVISSSGNKTSYTYNMLLAEDTARRVKKQFTSLYGKPLYTVGVGGSGGGLAQYLIAQNSRGILDGLIPLYSYPDMITQTTYALDCDLLNNYFTFRAADKNAWRDWERRRLIEGMNAINGFPQKGGFLQPINQLMSGFVPSFPKGSSECINGYFGLSAFINNPQQGFIREHFKEHVVDETKWSYWQDMSHVFGIDKNGFGLSTWDNVGVQYGLNALKAEKITLDEFLHLNAHIGGWKPQQQMQQEEIVLPFGHKLPIWLTLWGNHNITTPIDEVAPRHAGSIKAMNQAYKSGQVFIGNIDIPVIDARHYLENELDMHHMSASFYSRLRIQAVKGHSNNHVIWVAHKDFDPTKQAFEMMDTWLSNLKSAPNQSIISARPESLQDTCFNKDGSIYGAGAGVFDGQWNTRDEGVCQSRFPMFSTSRIEAGGGWDGAMFKCPLISVKKAIERGMYGKVNIIEHFETLQRIFPQGVCDYEGRDRGLPNDYITSQPDWKNALKDVEFLTTSKY
ncbi:DUF6351 family protein [Pseudoalteromonas luteoviolacea]|uniref:DUF6351 domain-containing protein n=1 Tax=Pseudoalteromonas luteoviolacea H33 TaxID=1365251 RepID=A0A161Y056_9GAMM|nr:DUF6351 family protein [Pseudoalteromonas luteoviolacea]KZN49141.1 hypothetical protein N476_20090 [Pseudoalteromonas luteoviolacea H33]KZN73571.1 hypothetical protein N477_22990 [Pseudoalteromonas luteoviolacea H33-S]